MRTLSSVHLVAFLCISFTGLLHADTMVNLDTPMGRMKFQLFDNAKPITVANFLNYITSGRYEDSFAHRYAFFQGTSTPFVIQGGGFTLEGNTITQVPTFGTILNEPGPFPEYSNTYGTLAMARSSGVNSATSQWFINLNNNSPLDSSNGGFTVFGEIIEGQEILQAIVSLFSDNNFDEWAVYNATNFLQDPTFGELPLRTDALMVSDLFYTDWSIVSVPEPGSMALLLTGVAAISSLGLRRLRRPVAH